MNEWKPQRFRQLLIPGYKDRFLWWTTVFAIGIGLLGVFGVITSIVQTILTFEAYKVSLEALKLQALAMNVTVY